MVSWCIGRLMGEKRAHGSGGDGGTTSRHSQ